MAKPHIRLRRPLSPSEWARAMPSDLEAVVFAGERIIFLQSPEAMTYALATVRTLWDPQNEDLLKQLQERFHATFN